MKLMKRILAIVCTFVMIISMATGVNAVEPAKAPTTSTKGSITIENAKAGETYKIYKILTLESYNKEKEAYSYVKNGDDWDGFVDQTKEYLNVNNDGYVTFVSDKTNSEGYRAFAHEAMAYAKKQGITATASKTAEVKKNNENTVEFTGLDLGYYLVESSVGTACSIGTTNPDAIIKDKHEAPSVSKLIIDESGVSGNVSADRKKNSVNIGDTVAFEVTINVQPYAKKYVLHDKMDNHLEFKGSYAIMGAYVHKKKENKNISLAQGQDKDFVVNVNPGDGCTFDISFTDKFYQEYENDINSKNLDKITFRYYATVKNDAQINTAMPNRAHLTYGENSKTDEVETKTYTWGIPVYKYTLNAGKKEKLANAKFILSTNNNPDENNALSFENTGNKYTYTSNGGTKELISYTDGMININGLKSGTYYLKETKAPDGYNTLKDPIKIVVTGDDTGVPVIEVRGEPVDQVEVQNNKGSLLPSTGGMGTTLIYVVGSILVLASGIVLFSKRKEGTN